MTTHNISSIISHAKALNGSVHKEPVSSRADGLQLAQNIESTLIQQGFTFADIEKDKHNTYCHSSRQGKKLIMGKYYVHVSIRLFQTNSQSFNVTVQVQ